MFLFVGAQKLGLFMILIVQTFSRVFKASMGFGFSVPDFWSSPGLWFPHLIEVVSVLFNLCFVLCFKVPAK